jgi:hypothetical protein
MGTLTNLNDVKRTLAIASNVNGTLTFDKNLDDTLIRELIEDASDYFSVETGNNYYGTNGTLTLDNTQRYVCGRKLFFRDDVLRSITRIENDGIGTLTSADWITMPKNSTPYYGVELRTQTWSYSDSPLGAIRVIGALGMNADGEPSNRVHLAVTRLASWLYQTRDTRGTVQFSTQTAQQGSDSVPNEVIQTIEKEKRHRVTA